MTENCRKISLFGAIKTVALLKKNDVSTYESVQEAGASGVF